MGADPSPRLMTRIWTAEPSSEQARGSACSTLRGQGCFSGRRAKEFSTSHGHVLCRARVAERWCP